VRAIPGSKPERVSVKQVDSTGSRYARSERSHNGRYAAIEFNGDLYVNDLTTGTARRLTQTVEAERNPQFSADDRQIFFVRDNNIYSLDLAGGLLRQLTDIRQGPAPTDSAQAQGQRGRLEQQQREVFESVRDRIRADSIARAERLLRDSLALKPVYLQSGETVSDFSISPIGTSLLITTRSPASGNRTTDIPQYVTRTGYTEELRSRNKVGDATQHGRVAMITLPSATVTWLKPFAADTATGSFDLLGWNDSGTRALLFASSSDNKMRILAVLDPAAKLTTLESLRHRLGWRAVQSLGGWYGAGAGRVCTPRSGRFSHSTPLLPMGPRQQLTKGRWRSATSTSRPIALVLSHHQRGIAVRAISYRMPTAGGAMERITTRPASTPPSYLPMAAVADVYSYVNRPPDLFLLRDRNGAEMSQLTASPSAEWVVPWITPEIVMIPASDGVRFPRTSQAERHES
jgi:dipeptidyl aminopeptidase/acylaminoacyl peptidase